LAINNWTGKTHPVGTGGRPVV